MQVVFNINVIIMRLYDFQLSNNDAVKLKEKRPGTQANGRVVTTRPHCGHETESHTMKGEYL